MALQGSFETFPLTDIFQLLGMQFKTGILTVKHGPQEIQVHFAEGSVTYASESKMEAENLLGKILVKSGLITPADLMDALAAQRRNGQKLGRILIDKGSIDEGTLRSILQTQTTQIIYKIFRLQKGEYVFNSDAEIKVDEDSFSPVPADHLLFEGVRLVDEWPVILKTIHSMDMVFKVKDNIPKETAFALNDDERRVFEHVDGRNSVQEIMYKTLFSEFEVSKALFNLLKEGIIEEDAQAKKKNAFNIDFVSPFLEATIDTLDIMCGLEVAAGKPRLKRPLELAKGDISSIVDLNGEKKGIFATTFPKTCALNIVNRMLGMDIKCIDHQIQDAIGEISNIIVGGGRRRLADMGFIMSASIPMVVVGSHHVIEHKTSAPCVVMPFETSCGQFSIELSLQR